MHDFHKHLAQTLSQRLQNRRVVVWYDPRQEFNEFVEEAVSGDMPIKCTVDSVVIAGNKTNICVLKESFFEAKFAIEPFVSADFPDPLLVYIPGKKKHDDTAVLMELEAGGETWEPSLKREARRVLQKRFGDGQIDEMLQSDNIGYQDIIGLTSAGTIAPENSSLLSVILSNMKGNNAEMIADWLGSDERDEEIQKKGADREIGQLCQSRLGLELDQESTLAEKRIQATRFLLLGEFRNDLNGDHPIR